jgi:large subunit ribosomal protein L13e
LKEYQAKLVLFPRNNAKKGAKLSIGVAPAEERANVSQLQGTVLPIKHTKVGAQWGTITDEARKKSAYSTLRHARADARLVGKRQVRQKKKAEKKAAKAAANKKD